MSSLFWKIGFFIVLSGLLWFGMDNAKAEGQTEGKKKVWYALALVAWTGLAVMSFMSPSGLYFKDVEAFSNRQPVVGSREIIKATSRGWKGGYDTAIDGEALQKVVDDMYERQQKIPKFIEVTVRNEVSKVPSVNEISTGVIEAIKKELPVLIVSEINKHLATDKKEDDRT